MHSTPMSQQVIPDSDSQKVWASSAKSGMKLGVGGLGKMVNCHNLHEGTSAYCIQKQSLY